MRFSTYFVCSAVFMMSMGCSTDPTTNDVAPDVLVDTAFPTDATAPADTTSAPEDTTFPPEDTTFPPEDTTLPAADTTTPPEDTQLTPCDTLCAGILAVGCEKGPGDEAACLALCAQEASGDCAAEWAGLESCVMAEMGMVQWVCGDDGSFAIAGDCSTEFGAWHACNTPGPDPCDPDPCQNEGNCKADADGNATCDCLEKYSGDFCETCNPICQPGLCGQDDGCGVMCGCQDGWSCLDDGTCCMPACDGKSCGDNGCGATCGTCGDGLICNDKGACVEAGANPKETLCTETSGQWMPMSCGDWKCGIEPLCKAIKPGCNCGVGRSFDAVTGCYKDDTCDGDACDPNPCPVGKNCKLKPNGDYICLVDVPDWCNAICEGMFAGCPDAMEGSVEDCAEGCADNFLDKCQPPHMAFANCFPGDGAWVCDPAEGIAPANGQCSKEWAAIAACENGEEPPAVCPDGLELLGEFATWCGKVNVHTDALTGVWMPDEKCTAGCNVGGVAYCQELYAGAAEIVEVPPSPEMKPFMTAGCQEEYPNQGKNQYACCGLPQQP
jgi:hypothetical protein